MKQFAVNWLLQILVNNPPPPTNFAVWKENSDKYMFNEVSGKKNYCAHAIPLLIFDCVLLVKSHFFYDESGFVNSLPKKILYFNAWVAVLLWFYKRNTLTLNHSFNTVFYGLLPKWKQWLHTVGLCFWWATWALCSNDPEKRGSRGGLNSVRALVPLYI